MASVTSICNSALVKIGAARIVSLDDPSEGARLCKEQYTKLKESLLQAHPWNFAVRRQALNLSPDVPAFGYSKQFIVPDDCLRILETCPDEVSWEREGNFLLTNYPSMAIRYIKNVDESLFTPLFAEVLSLALAADISYSLVQSVQLRTDLRQEFKNQLRDARSFDAQEGGVRQVQADEFIRPRFS